LLDRYVVQAEDFIVMAARQGLLAKVQPVICSPGTASPHRAIFAHFESRDYRIRHAGMRDLAALEVLEERCWAPGLRTSMEALESRLSAYPEGQFVLEVEGQVAGVIYSQRIESAESLRGVTAQDVLSLHRADGPVAQLVAANVLPEQQQRNLGDQLLEFMLQRCRFTPGIDSVVAVTLCKDYHKHPGVSPSEYIALRNGYGTLVDPILRFHELHGARVNGLIPGYRPADHRNQGSGVLVCYDIHQRRRAEIRTARACEMPAGETPSPELPESVREVVESLVKAKMNGAGEAAYSRDRPLMELGLDSTDLLTLSDAIKGRFGLKLDATFFFRHNTVEKILAHVHARMSVATEAASMEVAGEETPRRKTIEPATAAATDVAVIGMACRLPGNVRSPAEFWTLLSRNESAIGSAPEGRWQWPARSGSLAHYPGIDRGGFLESVDCFDAGFFRISPREAQWMDPQQRLLLELSWEALEDAGYGGRQLFDTGTAVYVGASGSDYRVLLDQSSPEVEPYLGTGNSMAMLANRISYFHGFRGPSLTIDTACSSSMVALHHAVRSVQRGESAQALVAGVNVICDPSISLSYYKAGMLSPDGLCRTFDEKANGYVRSEGAVVLLIKSLAAAVRDKDPIHAVIKGTSCNHGGQAAGLTVPNPRQQASLLLEAWEASGVSPETLGYIEAHGSATPLGDAVEADGLKEAFRSVAAGGRRDRTVGLGSVKSNLGHLEAAAGLAGFLKTVLCLKKQRLVASVNFEQLNLKIDFSDSVFYVVTGNRPWTVSEEMPLRRAGVSSFGSGGTNAHAVLEEYLPMSPASGEPIGPFAMTLSARTEERLSAYARRLLDHLGDMDEREVSLASIACSLQRRLVMEKRVVFPVRTVAELKGSLESLARGIALSGNPGRDPAQEVAETGSCHRLHLPPYPFARDRHWIRAESDAVTGRREASAAEPLHSLAHEHTSGPSCHSFHWRFTGREPVFRDHVVAGERVFPGVAYLEMARTALVEAANGTARFDRGGIRLTGVVWLRPLVAEEEDVELDLVMGKGTEGRVAYEVTAHRKGSQDAPVVHHQGLAEWTSVREVAAVDIPQLQSAMTVTSVGHDQCYARLGVLGFEYGPTHRCIETLYIGAEQVLAKLRLPAGFEPSSGRGPQRPELHPALMDAALQAALFGLARGAEPLLPFALQELDLISECSSARWAWIRPTTPNRPLSGECQFDIDLCDERGRVCVQLRGLSFRAPPQEPAASEQGSSQPLSAMTILCPTWDIVAPPSAPIFPDVNAHVAVIGGTPEQHDTLRALYPHAHRVEVRSDSIAESAAKLGSLARLDHLVWIAPGTPLKSLSADITNEQHSGILQVFRLVKSLHLLGYGRKELAWTLITTQTQAVDRSEVVNPIHAGIHGFVGSMAKEHPHWSIRLLDMEEGSNWPAREMFALPFHHEGDALAYRRGQWSRPVLLPLGEIATGPSLYRPQGVYVVIGGAGGLGEVWSRMMIQRHQASIVWIGRREIDAAISRKVAALAALGPAPVYIRADATDRKSLQSAYQAIKLKHARIHGVVHSAIVLQDESLVNIDEERFRSGLASKLDASVRMAEVFEAEPLDLVLFFSSILAYEKPPGQSNYAAGCTFSDAFAARMNREWNCAVKVVNWGYWGTTGAVASALHRERMGRRGYASIDPEQGMTALQRLIESPLPQLAIVSGTPSGIQSQLMPGDRLTVYPATVPSVSRAVAAHLQTLPPRATGEQLTGGLQTPTGREHLLCRLLLGSIQALRPACKQGVPIADLKAAVTGPGFYGTWLDESLAMLKKSDLLQEDGRGTLAWAPLEPDTLWAEWDRAKRADCDRLSPQVALLESCLRALPRVLTGKQPATDLLFGGANAQLLERIYRGNPASDFYNSVLQSVVVAYLEARLSEDPAARFRLLEIGAGTGGTTAGLLPELDVFRDHIEEYCFTDISKAFLIHAEDRYAPRHSYLTTRLFDVSRPLAGQGIDAGSYDLVLATNVLHATVDIRWALRNAKAAMRKHGLLVLNELSAGSLFTHLTFGLLPGWWLHQDSSIRIPGCPGLDPRGWAGALSDEGFGSVLFPAENAHRAGQQIVVAESDGIVRQASASSQSSPATIKTDVAGSAHQNGTTLRPVAESGAGPMTERMLEDHVKSTVRESVSDVLRMEETRIRNDRSFSDYGVDSIVGVQLVRRIGEAYGIGLPTMVVFDHNSVDGLTGYLLNEYQDRIRAALGVSPPAVGRPPISDPDPPLPDAPPPEPAVNAGVTAPSPGSFYHVAIEGPGELDGLRIVEGIPQALDDRDVRVSVRAFALNYADLLCVRGLYPNMPPYPFTPGLEASGVVVEVGRAVTRLRPGDPVILDVCLRMGTHATMVTCSEDEAVRKPGELSFEQACALPVSTLTMIEAFDRANLRPGDRVLIQTAAGGTGLAAVQLAQLRGAEIYATAGSQEKLDYLSTLGVRHLINYRETDFELELRKLCEGRGMDVVINTLPGEFIQKGLRCLAAGGRYVELAMAALKSARSIDLSVLSSNQTFIGVDLPKLSKENPARIGELRAEMIRLQKAGAISPTVCRVFPFDKHADAYRFLEARQNIGKIVVRIPEGVQYRAGIPNGAPGSAHAASVHGAVDDSIAVIGMSGRFARSENLEKFWKHLAEGTDLVERVSRWDVPETRADADAPGGSRSQCAHGSFLDGIDLFDPLFFGISGMEATYMDPQQRLLLEEAWKALEDAGYAGEQIHGHNCGVYIGCTAGDYSRILPGDRPAQAFWGNHGSVIPARISYFLNLRGPAIAVDTACSSSLVATHLACQSLRLGETDMALAGGVFVQSTPEFYELANGAGMLSPTGCCRTFDAKADGFVPGEAVAAVVLKRLRDALADGDHICAVIRGSATNQDGRSNGITAPSAKSQESLECQVYDRYNIDPETIQLIEAHGTGTNLGDPIEFEGLTRAFRRYTQRLGFCAIGSVKTNIGHSAMAAGIAGLVKILLSLKHRQLPPSLHFEVGNPKLAIESSPFYVRTQLGQWEVGPTGVRRAAISSFGFSGTNAHMVIESAPWVDRQHRQDPGYLVVLSARSASQLRRQIENLEAFCEANPDVDLGNMSYTLLVGRAHCTHRLAVVARSVPEVLGYFRKWLKRGSSLQVLTAELGESDRQEDPGLNRHGNQCIESSRAALSDTRYLEHLATVAELFIRGYRLQYQRLFGEGFSRIPMPTYPFAKESYWASREVQTARRDEMKASGHPPGECGPAQTRSSDRWLCVEEAWRSAALPDDLDWNERLRQCAGMSILVVSVDDADKQAMLSLLKLLTEAAGGREDFKLRSIAASDIDDDAWPGPVDVVLMLGSRRSEAGPVSRTPSGIDDVFHLSQWLMRRAWDAQIRLYYLYEGASSHPRPDNEALSGFMRSAMQENERHVWTLVGALDAGPENSRYQLLVKEWLYRDARLAPPSFSEVRYASSDRLIHRLQATTLRTPSAQLLRSDRTYVVAGGFGPVGWLLCEELARLYRPALVILSRGECDPSRQRMCRTLESLGSKVHYYAVDIADRSALAETYSRVASEVGAVHGVIHLARLVEDGFIVGKTWASFQRVCAAKVEGTRNLDEVTANEPLDFFTVFSSMAAFGIRGSADYGYSSAFQNAFVRHRNRLKARGERAGHAVALCWGAWAVDSYMPKDRDENLKTAGYEFIGVNEALPYIEAACTGQHEVVGLMAVGDRSKVRKALALDCPTGPQWRHELTDGLKDRIAAWEAQKAAGAQALLPPIQEIVSLDELEGLDPRLVDRLYQLLFDASQSSAPKDRVVDAGNVGIRQRVSEVVSEVLRLSRVDENRTFQGYGLDSITATRIAVRLERSLKRAVQPRWLIDYPTVERLAAHLESVEQESSRCIEEGSPWQSR
jgi:acyl transferase domain-containing protein/NADPH:quinone reductase-like Zn-dependent oxidoreductase/acyl carrier protein/ribosomal protein S18 acetylase RimI-like enzyme